MSTRPADPETTNGGLAWRERLFTTLQRRGAIVVLILVVAVSALVFDNFLTEQNLENIVLQGAFLGLIVVGMTFVIISGGIDLSVGSMLGLGGIIAAQTVQVFWPLALILPPLLCGVIGFGNGLLIAKAKMAPFIVTLAGLLGIRGLALALANERPIGIDTSSLFAWFGQGQVFGIAVPIVFVIVAFALGGLVLARTGYGRVIFAIGGSEESARLMGLPVDRTKIIAYTVSGSLAGLSGALLAARLSAGDPNAGLAGVLLLSILQNLINQLGTLGSYAQQVVSGFFLIVVVVAQAYLTRKERS
jgi:galactofuranose transport system permease protein